MFGKIDEKDTEVPNEVKGWMENRSLRYIAVVFFES